MKLLYVVNEYVVTDDPKDLIDRLYTMKDWVSWLTSLDIGVVVCIRYESDYTFTLDNVKYYFISDNLPNKLRQYHFPIKFNKRVTEIILKENVNLIHGHNLFHGFSHYHLHSLNSELPYLIQDHSGQVSISHAWWLKYCYKKISAVVFSSKGHEIPWVKKSIFRTDQCHFIMENSSSFTLIDKNVARKKTRLSGKPIFLWVGNLDKNKDPLTVLKAFKSYTSKYSLARLYMIYRLTDNEEAIKLYIESEPALKSNVIMLGPKEREDLEFYFNSADYFVSASYKEGSGYALIEALSCGMTPIVTAIPSFIDLTQKGNIGYLYPPGDHKTLEQIFCDLPDELEKDERKRIREYFMKRFSFHQIAIKAKELYLELLPN